MDSLSLKPFVLAIALQDQCANSSLVQQCFLHWISKASQMRVFASITLVPFFLTLSGGEFFQDLNFRLENHQLKGITETVAQNGAMHSGRICHVGSL